MNQLKLCQAVLECSNEDLPRKMWDVVKNTYMLGNIMEKNPALKERFKELEKLFSAN